MRALALTLALAACHADGGDEVDTDTDTGPAPTPTLAFVTPSADAVIVGAEVDVELAITDFALVGPALGARASEAPGPAWLWLLQGTAAAHEAGEAPEGYVELTLDDATSSQMSAKTTSLFGVAPGAHHLHAELLWPDGDAFYPAILADVDFTVSAE